MLASLSFSASKDEGLFAILFKKLSLMPHKWWLLTSTMLQVDIVYFKGRGEDRKLVIHGPGVDEEKVQCTGQSTPDRTLMMRKTLARWLMTLPIVRH